MASPPETGDSRLVALRRRPEPRAADSEPADAAAVDRRLYLETYGCQMNVADSDLLSGLLGGRGYRRVASPADADIIMINTCAVRERAEERVYARARELSAEKRRREGVLLAVVG